MNFLVGDIGNTNIKICKINNDFKIKKPYLFATTNATLDKFLAKPLGALMTMEV